MSALVSSPLLKHPKNLYNQVRKELISNLITDESDGKIRSKNVELKM
jgi:hypothetical protein